MPPDSRSVLSRSARRPDRTLAYGAFAEQVVDVWLPSRPAGPILLIFLHGGFWRSAYDRAHVAPVAAAFAASGYVVAVPEYRRTGHTGGGWPTTFDDVRSAVAAVPALLVDHRPAGVVLAGHSAGGQLALWAAKGARPAGVVALAPVADLRAAYELDLDGGAAAALLGGGPDTVADRYRQADPMARLPLGVPCVLVHGDRDRQVPVWFSQRYADTARAAGDDVRLVVLPATDHFALIDPESAAWPAVVAAVSAVDGSRPPPLTSPGGAG